MINKEELRKAVASVLKENRPYEFKYVDKDILNSKEFIQKMYRKSKFLFNWLPLYLDDKQAWLNVVEEQEKIELGNAFNHFCKESKLIKSNHKVDIDNLSQTEQKFFKPFKELYDLNKKMKESLLKISDYATYGIANTLTVNDEFNFYNYVKMDESNSLKNTYVELAKETLKIVEDKGFST